MRVEHQIILEFSELSEEAKHKAHENYISKGWGDHDGSDNRKSLEEFEKYFPVNIKNWEYGYQNFINWSLDYMDEGIEELRGNRLRTFLLNNYIPYLENPKTYYSKDYKKIRKSKIQRNIECPFTGYYLDMVLIEPLLKFINEPNKQEDMYSIMNDCLNEWVSACSQDVEYQNSFEYFEEMCERNYYEFLQDGTFI